MLPDEVPAVPGDDEAAPEQPRLQRWWRRMRRHTETARRETREASDPTDGGCEWGCDWFDGCNALDGCDGCDACSGCDLMRLSTVLLVVAALTPPAASGATAVAALRFYRRRLTRWTPRCPSTPSCSAYALEAVGDLGPRRGLAAAARRVRACGT